MGYAHINNLYADQRVLLETELWALEKVHGTSAHVSWKSGTGLAFFSGEQQEAFAALFDEQALGSAMALALPPDADSLVIYGEAHGGKVQRQAWRYGPELCFVAFEARIGERWLTVPEAAALATALGLEFVAHRRIPATLNAIDAERDAPSEQARRRGLEPKPEDAELGRCVPGGFRREGVVLRPLVEKSDERHGRVMAKHKRDEERETKSSRPVDPGKLVRMTEARAIADEWVTEARLDHVLAALGMSEKTLEPSDIGPVVRGMLEDVLREGAAEIAPSQDANRAIGTRAAQLMKRRMAGVLAAEPQESQEPQEPQP